MSRKYIRVNTLIWVDSIKQAKDVSITISKNAQRVLKLLLENKLMTIEGISNETNIPVQEVKHILIELMAKGYIKKKKVILDIDN